MKTRMLSKDVTTRAFPLEIYTLISPQNLFNWVKNRSSDVVYSFLHSFIHLLFIYFRLKLKKIGKTIRPLRYDLIQIPYDCTVEVRNRFKGLDLTDRVLEELWTEVCGIV